MVDPAFPACPAAACRDEPGGPDYDGIRRAAAAARSAAMAGQARRVFAVFAALLVPGPVRHRRARPLRLHRSEEVF